jgi:hypothetical protein
MATIATKREAAYRRSYFRTREIAAIISEVVCSPQMMVRWLREGTEFVALLR